MPIVNVKTMKGALTAEKKAELFKRITELFVEIEGNGNNAIKPYVFVTIDEEVPENFGIGGKQANSEFIKKVTYQN